MKYISIIVLILLYSFVYGYDDVLKEVDTGRSIELDKEGNIYTPKDEHTIHKYSPSGKFILKFGRRGRGPGDIQRLGGFTVHPVNQNIYIAEFYGGNRWISVFSPQGKLVDTWNIKLDFMEWKALLGIEFDKGGNAYVIAYKNTARAYKSFWVDSSHYCIFKVKPDGAIERTIYRLYNNDDGVHIPPQGSITIPFHNGLQFDIQDNIIALNENHDNFIQLFSTDGKPVKKLVLPYEMERVQKEDIDEWEKTVRKTQFYKRRNRRGTYDLKFWKKNMPFPKYKRLTYGTSFDKRGNILVLKLNGYSMQGKDRIWYKVSIETGKVTTHNFGKNVSLLAVDRNYFYMCKYDEDDGPITYRLNRKKINF